MPAMLRSVFANDGIDNKTTYGPESTYGFKVFMPLLISLYLTMAQLTQQLWTADI